MLLRLGKWNGANRPFARLIGRRSLIEEKAVINNVVRVAARLFRGRAVETSGPRGASQFSGMVRSKEVFGRSVNAYDEFARVLPGVRRLLERARNIDGFRLPSDRADLLTVDENSGDGAVPAIN